MAAKTEKKLVRTREVKPAMQRREEILDMATKVFAKNGYPNTDLQVIADKLKIGKGTLYRLFPSKRTLFLSAADRGMHNLRARVETDMADAADPLDRIARAIRSYLAFFDAHTELIELLIQERAEFKDREKPTYFEHRDANLGPWQELFRGLIAEGRVRDLPVDRIIDVMSNLLYGTMFTNYFAGKQKSFEEETQDILDIVFNGILSTKERLK